MASLQRETAPKKASNATEKPPRNKNFYRKKVWSILNKKHLNVNNLYEDRTQECYIPWLEPGPLGRGRIPNFRGINLAIRQLLDMPEFQNAKSVGVNREKSLETCRRFVLNQKKDLYVTTPHLPTGFLRKLTANKRHRTRTIASTAGMEKYGELLDLENEISLDLLIVGSVAVGRNGHRIGKGKGYVDLEFGILKEIKAVNDNTVIVTIVHDLQVFDYLPSESFQKYDILVDYILTPTQVIKTIKNDKLMQPEGVYWDLLSENSIRLMPVLGILRSLCRRKGKNVTLKGMENGKMTRTEIKLKKLWRKKRENKLEEEPKQVMDNVFIERAPPMKLKHRYHLEFSLVVSRIDKSVRLSQFKNELKRNGIWPEKIVWFSTGFCHLHFGKRTKKYLYNPEKINELSEKSIKNIIEIVKNIDLTMGTMGTWGKCLKVKKMRRNRTRIGRTNVRAV